jgi:hypothetical protein
VVFHLAQPSHVDLLKWCTWDSPSKSCAHDQNPDLQVQRWMMLKKEARLLRAPVKDRQKAGQAKLLKQGLRLRSLLEASQKMQSRPHR